jgi:hypothetical protein
MNGFDETVEKPRASRNPPIGRRFPKGVSGNPKGRPRKARALVATKIEGKPGIGYEDKVKELAIQEAYRRIAVRDGNRVKRIPIIQAILRKIAVSAANGNVRAQQEFLKLLVGAEADRRVATMELLKAAFDYKEYNTRVLDERERLGISGPEPVPHPDDVNINYGTGEFRIDGPPSPELKEAWEELEAEKIERGLEEVAERIAADGNCLEQLVNEKKFIGLRERIAASRKRALRSAKGRRLGHSDGG